ncbi:hypothetical protein KAU55_03675 [Candidatus Bathyarchaeota archaeon]|nr:hypothetical protein [Candidatus Bathyarchaeota archaeon]
MTGIVLLVVSFSGGTMKLLSTKINPNIAMALNFFLPGLGFVYCRRVYFYLIGAILFVATMGPLSWFTIPNIIGTAITNLSALSLQKVILALLLNSLLGVLAYFAAEYVKKSEGGE